ncbi:MAG TPA: Asp-tRNA(Asn)/Glu-tRNA(Gln) amidotransferase subunit GatC [Spirochaetota bacterium]
MAIDIKTLERTTILANLHISDEEKEAYTKQLAEIVTYVEAINSLDTSNVHPTDHIAELSNVFRVDTILPSIDVSAIEKIAPQFERSHIVVPKIIDGEA